MAGNWCSSCGGPAVVAGDAAAAWPGTAAVGPQTGQLRGGVQTVVQDLACPLPSIYLSPPPSLPGFLFPFFAGIHSIPPACGRDRRVQGRLLFPDIVSREEIPSQFGEKSKALPACRNTNPLLHKTKSPFDILIRHPTTRIRNKKSYQRSNVKKIQ